VPVLLERRAVPRVDVPLGVVGRIDLDVVAAELDQPIDDVLAEDAGDVAVMISDKSGSRATRYRRAEPGS
jgi:hypothetical protein